MSKRTDTYKRLGDYIRQVDVRNKDLRVERLLGVSISKDFMPSIANTIGTDMSNYKIVRQGQFAYGPVTSRNGDKVSIALLNEEEAIISQAYTVFEIVDTKQLCSEYLMMWFHRPEFDRYARFHSHGSAREIFDWQEMCDVMLPIPSIDRQREIVAQYETITRRIRINEQIIARLEDAAKALYRKMFVDGIDKEKLPEGWRMGTLGEVATVSSGKTCKNKTSVKDKKHFYPVAGASGIIGYSSEYNQDKRILTTGRVGTLGVVNRYNEPIYAADNVLVATSNFYEYTFQLLSMLNYTEITKGGVQNLVTQTDLSNYKVVIPENTSIRWYESKSSIIYTFIELVKAENKLHNESQSLLLTRMTQTA